MEYLIFTIIGLGILLFTVRLMANRRAHGLSGEAFERANELQFFLTTCVADLGRVLEQEGVGAETVRQQANEILAKMESRNVAGHLDAFIQDNRESVDLTLARGNAS